MLKIYRLSVSCIDSVGRQWSFNTHFPDNTLIFMSSFFKIPPSIFYLLVQIFIAFIQVFMLQAPFILHMDVGVEFPRQRLVQLNKTQKTDISSMVSGPKCGAQ